MQTYKSQLNGDRNWALMEGTIIFEPLRLVVLNLSLGKASHRTGVLNDVQSFTQVLLYTLDFANELISEARDVYLAKWKDAQQALKEEY